MIGRARRGSSAEHPLDDVERDVHHGEPRRRESAGARTRRRRRRSRPRWRGSSRAPPRRRRRRCTGAKPSFAAAIESTPEPQPTSSRLARLQRLAAARGRGGSSRARRCRNARPGSITTGVASGGASSHGGPTQKAPDATPWWNSRQPVLPALPRRRPPRRRRTPTARARRRVGVDGVRAVRAPRRPPGRARAVSASSSGSPPDDDERASAERALQLARRSPSYLPYVRSSARSSNSSQQAPLLVVQVARHEDVDEHPAGRRGRGSGEPACPRPRRTTISPGCVPGCSSSSSAVERRDRHGGAERGLRQGQVDGRVDVVAPRARIARRGRMCAPDVDVPGAAADSPGVALAGHADPLAVVDPRRDVDLERSLLDDAARAPRHSLHGCSILAARARRRSGTVWVRTNSPKTLRVTCCSRPDAAARSGSRDHASARFSAVTAAAACRSPPTSNGTVARSAASRLDEARSRPSRPDRRRARDRLPSAPPSRTSSPKNAEKRSARLPKSTLTGLEATAAAGPRGRTGRTGRASPTSTSTSYASTTSRNRSSASGRVGHVGMELARKLAEGPLDLGLARLPVATPSSS